VGLSLLINKETNLKDKREREEKVGGRGRAGETE